MAQWQQVVPVAMPRSCSVHKHASRRKKLRQGGDRRLELVSAEIHSQISQMVAKTESRRVSLSKSQPILYYAILYYTILCYTILYYTILYYTILYYTILYYTILYYTILYCTLLYTTLLYSTRLDWTGLIRASE